jgi:hypothetical protein
MLHADDDEALESWQGLPATPNVVGRTNATQLHPHNGTRQHKLLRRPGPWIRLNERGDPVAKWPYTTNTYGLSDVAFKARSRSWRSRCRAVQAGECREAISHVPSQPCLNLPEQSDQPWDGESSPQLCVVTARCNASIHHGFLGAFC